jgi:hypothetical protein
MTLKNWVFALIIAGATVAGGNYVYDQGAIETDLQTENLGISEVDTDIHLDDISGWVDGIKGIADQLKEGIKNIIDEYLDKN